MKVLDIPTGKRLALGLEMMTVVPSTFTVDIGDSVLFSVFVTLIANDAIQTFTGRTWISCLITESDNRSHSTIPLLQIPSTSIVVFDTSTDMAAGDDGVMRPSLVGTYSPFVDVTMALNNALPVDVHIMSFRFHWYAVV